MFWFLFNILVAINLALGKQCEPSETTKNGIKQCSGDIIFEENFDKIDPSVWKATIQFSSEDDDAVIYKKDSDILFTSKGILNIGLKVLEDSAVKNSTVILDGCTGAWNRNECRRKGRPHNYLPGVISSQICTKNSFNFKYGIVQIRAKLPTGDWVIPQIWLKPAKASYGPGYDSGKIRIVMVRGNKDLKLKDKDIGQALAYSSVFVRDKATSPLGLGLKARTAVVTANKPWPATFRNYTLIWEKDDISFSFEEDGSKPISLVKGFKGRLADLMDLNREDLKGPISPFDEEFHLCLGLSVANTLDFPEGAISGSERPYKKPYQNKHPKAQKFFWDKKESWLSTWANTPKLLVDRIVVRAL